MGIYVLRHLLQLQVKSVILTMVKSLLQWGFFRSFLKFECSLNRTAIVLSVLCHHFFKSDTKLKRRIGIVFKHTFVLGVFIYITDLRYFCHKWFLWRTKVFAELFFEGVEVFILLVGWSCFLFFWRRLNLRGWFGHLSHDIVDSCVLYWLQCKHLLFSFYFVN